MLEKIESLICILSGLKPEQIHTKSRHLDVRECRHTVMYFARKETFLSLSAIAGYFEQDHATALNAIRTVKNYMETDPVFNAKIASYQAEVDKLKPTFEKIEALKAFYKAVKMEVDYYETAINEQKAKIELLKIAINGIQ